MKLAEDYILCQEEPYCSILSHLQAIIKHAIPDADLLFKWKISC